MTPAPFPQLLHAFFHEWLGQQRNVSHRTILSYRDSWRLFLQFVAAQKTTSVAKLGLSNLSLLAEGVDVTVIRDWNGLVIRTFVLLDMGAEGGIVQGFHDLSDVEPIPACRCADITVIADPAKSELLEQRDRRRVTPFHVAHGHVAANQLIESKH